MAEETNKIILGKNQFATIVNNPDETDQATTVTITTKKRKNKRGGGSTVKTTETVYTKDDNGNFKDTNGNLLVGDERVKKINDTIQNNAKTEPISPITGNVNSGGASVASGKEGSISVTTPLPVAKTHPGTRTNYPQELRYPEEMLDDQDFMKIDMMRYKAGNFKTGKEGRASDRITESLGSVLLPIPSQLVDSNQVSWNNHSMNNLQMGGAQRAMELMSSGMSVIDTAGKQVKEVLEAAQREGGAYAKAFQTVLLGQIPGINATANQLFARQSGAILNPNLELLFNGPQLRSFTYQFRLSPRNDKETVKVKQIIRFFKQGMSVKEATPAMFLQSPNVFGVRFYNGKGRQHEFLNTLKKCALTGFGVNYVPDGTYMTLPDSSMTSYNMTLSLQELDPIFDSDYSELDNNKDTVIGY